MEAIKLPEPIKTSIKGCARCHGDGHEGLTFKPLTFPLELEDGEPPMTHWCPCPRNGEPIMLCIRQTEGE
jgi:hypothetical protein